MTNIKSVASVLRTDTNSAYHHYFDYVVSRSVAVLQDLTNWSKDLLKPRGKLITIKGENIAGEIHKTKKLDFVKNIEVIEVIEVNDRKIVIVNYK